MDGFNSNVLSLTARLRDSRRDTDPRQSPEEGEAGGRVRLVDRLKGQTVDYERAISQLTSVRDSVDLSADGAIEALARFEKTLENLKLSLQHHRESTLQIENASLAGEAAAKVKALMIDGQFDPSTVLRHTFSSEILDEVLRSPTTHES